MSWVRMLVWYVLLLRLRYWVASSQPILQPCISPPPTSETLALQTLYNCTAGASWLWLPESTAGQVWSFVVPINPCNDWQGVTCSLVDNSCHIDSLVLDAYGLQGYLPDELCNLTYLHTLQLSTNTELVGSIPHCLGQQLTYLHSLDLSANALTSSIPNSITWLTQLSELILYENQLTGSLPVDLGNMTMLSYLDLSINPFRSSIPASFTKLRNLSKVFILEANLYGTIPDNIGDITSLLKLDISTNQLTGTIPLSVGNLTQLLVLSFAENELKGSIPNIFHGLNQLNYLGLFSNYLTGFLPSSLLGLVALTELYLHENLLYGTIPNAIDSLTLLEHWDIDTNFFTGTIPESITNLNKLGYVYLYENLFHGSIPVQLGRLQNMVKLDLSVNMLSSAIPATISNISTLVNVWMDHNQLTGSVPSMANLQTVNLAFNYLQGTLAFLGNTSSIRQIQLNDNLFTGSIPQAVNSYKSLLGIGVQNNMLSGSIICLFDEQVHTQLSLIDLSNNAFTASLPTSIFQLPSLSYFAAAKNCFTGSIPSSVCSSNATLQGLVLDGLHSASSCQQALFPGISRIHTLAETHSIRGTLPDYLFGEMLLLQILHVSGNGLSGSLPNQYPMLSSRLTQLSYSHNALTGTIPIAFQNHGFMELDLSFNKLSGGLSSDMNATGYYMNSTTTDLQLNNNRLSGHIPAVLLDVPVINILSGNMFGCDGDRDSNLPEHDPHYETYMCGSDETNNSLLAYIVAVFMLGIIFALVRTLKCVHSSDSEKQGPAALLPRLMWRFGFHLKKLTNLAADRTLLQQTPTYATFFLILRRIEHFMCLLTVILLAISLICYCVLGKYFSSYEHKYVWTISIGYLTGQVPGICLFLLMICLMVLLFVDIGPSSTKPSCPQMVTIIRKTLYLGNIVNYDVPLQANEEVETDSVEAKELPNKWRYAWFVLAFLLLNASVVMAINSIYVALIISGISTSQQAILTVAMSLFKDIWRYCIMRSLRWKFMQDIEMVWGGETVTRLMLTICLFNNIIAPCIATAFVNDNCFYYSIKQAPHILSSYGFSTCQLLYDTGECAKYDYISISTTYEPPFTYTFNCSSTLLSLFCPVWIFMFLFNGVVTPVLSLVVMAWNGVVVEEESLSAMLPSFAKSLLSLRFHSDAFILKKLLQAQQKDKVRSQAILFFDSRNFTIVNCNSLAIILCFGTLFPPLFVAGTISLLGRNLMQKVVFMRIMALEEKLTVNDVGLNDTSLQIYCSRELFQVLQRQCQSLPRIFLTTMKTLVLYVSVIWASFLWDIVGDEVGGLQALPFFVLLIVVGVCIRLVNSDGNSLLFSWKKEKEPFSLTKRPVSQSVELGSLPASPEIKIVQNPLNQPQT